MSIYGEHHPNLAKCTPLDLAAYHDDVRMANMLMDAGAKPSFNEGTDSNSTVVGIYTSPPPPLPPKKTRRHNLSSNTLPILLMTLIPNTPLPLLSFPIRPQYFPSIFSMLAYIDA